MVRSEFVGRADHFYVITDTGHIQVDHVDRQLALRLQPVDQRLAPVEPGLFGAEQRETEPVIHTIGREGSRKLDDVRSSAAVIVCSWRPGYGVEMATNKHAAIEIR